MKDLKTQRAQIAYQLSDIKKDDIPDDLLYELVDDFEKLHDDVEVKCCKRNPEPFGWNVYIKTKKETLKLYTDWSQKFKDHGYPAPFLTVEVIE